LNSNLVVCPKQAVVHPQKIILSMYTADSLLKNTVKKRLAIFPVPSRDVTNQTLPGGV
jgi:hypothetical protein